MVKIKTDQREKDYSVGIIGCGWLGKPLVKALVEQSYPVVATTQNKDKLKKIEQLGAHAELLSLPSEETNLNSVFNCQTLVVCITPQIRQGKKDYPKKIAQIVKCAEQGKVEKIILLSTTAVYDGIFGSATEQAELKHELPKVNILAQAELEAQSFIGKTIIMRCAGLIGKDRHPGRFFRNTKVLSSPNAYVNLIHQDDVVAQILAFIKSSIHSGIFNAVSEMQVTKKHYYTIAANALQLPDPVFDNHSELELGKQVIGDKLRDKLDYHFIHADLVTWLLKPSQ